jgi:hypothetical protein
MRQDIAFALIALLVAGISISWWLAARNKRRTRRSSLRVDILKKHADE